MVTSRLFRAVVAATALVAPLTVPALHGRATAAGAGQLAGMGTTTPGVPVVGCAMYPDVTFDGTATYAGTGFPSGPYPVSFRGRSDVCETRLYGAGSGTLSGNWAGALAYTRTGNITVLTGYVSIAGSAYHALNGWCLTSHTTVDPATSYAWACVWT